MINNGWGETFYNNDTTTVSPLISEATPTWWWNVVFVFTKLSGGRRGRDTHAENRVRRGSWWKCLSFTWRRGVECWGHSDLPFIFCSWCVLLHTPWIVFSGERENDLTGRKLTPVIFDFIMMTHVASQVKTVRAQWWEEGLVYVMVFMFIVWIPKCLTMYVVTYPCLV